MEVDRSRVVGVEELVPLVLGLGEAWGEQIALGASMRWCSTISAALAARGRVPMRPAAGCAGLWVVLTESGRVASQLWCKSRLTQVPVGHPTRRRNSAVDHFLVLVFAGRLNE